MKRIFSPVNLLLALAAVLFIISASVVLVLNFRPLYYFDIGFLHIPAYSGFPREEIIQNYDALIDYNNFFGPATLVFPTLPMSETGRIHFEEVKVVFVFFEYLCLVSGVLLAAGAVYRYFHKNSGWLLLSGVMTLGIPALLGLLIALNWEQVFVMFHQIVFANDYWIFSAETDPVILMLPDEFFMHCALGILLLVVTGSGVCFLLYAFSRKKENRK